MRILIPFSFCLLTARPSIIQFVSHLFTLSKLVFTFSAIIFVYYALWINSKIVCYYLCVHTTKNSAVHLEDILLLYCLLSSWSSCFVFFFFLCNMHFHFLWYSGTKVEVSSRVLLLPVPYCTAKEISHCLKFAQNTRALIFQKAVTLNDLQIWHFQRTSKEIYSSLVEVITLKLAS